GLRRQPFAHRAPGNLQRPFLAARERRAERTGNIQSVERSTSMGYRVLIADDSPVMRGFVRRVIELSGFDLAACYEAGDGEEALALLRHESVDAIPTHLNLPRLDGEELIRRLAADGRLRSIPAIVISTDSTQNRIARLLSLGARGYVTKPFTPETLRAELERT